MCPRVRACACAESRGYALVRSPLTYLLSYFLSFLDSYIHFDSVTCCIFTSFRYQSCAFSLSKFQVKPDCRGVKPPFKSRSIPAASIYLGVDVATKVDTSIGETHYRRARDRPALDLRLRLLGRCLSTSKYDHALKCSRMRAERENKPGVVSRASYHTNRSQRASQSILEAIPHLG